MKQWLGRLVVLLVVFAASGSLIVGSAYADDSSSAHYQFVNSEVGGGGLGTSSSTNFQSILSTADNVVSSGSSDSSSANYTVAAGSQTPHNPTLSIAITNGNATFNSEFSATSTATATAQFQVEDYTSYGYVVQIVGNTPSNGSHAIPAMGNVSTGPVSPTQGTEQFGLNLTQNTTPSVGSTPNYGQFGTTTAKPEPNYNIANKFLYSSGDSVAYSPKSSGQITYTISYMVNVGQLTPGGNYTSNQSIICTGTF
jgi:hypothetical protein